MNPIHSKIKSSTAEFEKIVRRARRASAPCSPDAFRLSSLVDLKDLVPSLSLDLKYASSDNFLGHRLYSGNAALLQEPVAQSLAAAQAELNRKGFGLLIYDAYRPWWVTRVFWDATPVESRTFVANPASGSRHNRGCAVDVGLVRLVDQSVIEMPSDFDEFSERASVLFSAGSDSSRRNRDLLIETMTRHDFSVYSAEWWHFDHILWSEYPILNDPVVLTQ